MCHTCIFHSMSGFPRGWNYIFMWWVVFIPSLCMSKKYLHKCCFSLGIVDSGQGTERFAGQ